MQSLIAFVISAFVAIGLYMAISVMGKAASPAAYGRKAAAWLVAIGTVIPSTLPHALYSPKENHFVNGMAAWLTTAIIFGGIAFLGGWLYGKYALPSEKSVAPELQSSGSPPTVDVPPVKGQAGDPIAVRLSRLDDLLRQGAISESEHVEHRRKILGEI